MQFDLFSTSLLTDDVPGTKRFYVDHFGFEQTTDIGWFVSLGYQGGPYELCIWQRDHEAVPEGFREPATGLVLAFRVADAAAEEARLRGAGVTLVAPVRDEPWGQRHFFVADPGGVLIDVVQTIAPDPDWLAEHGLA
jgi:catechol 2,3-dioxygenase-like lactoylglutathione lyase family enzyme